MFFKRNLRTVSRMLLSAVLASSGLSCGIKVGEKPAPAFKPSYSGEGYRCVGLIPEFMGDYVADKVDELQITEFVRCLQKSFTSFAQLTRGRDQDIYSPDEIRRFLQTYFLKNRQVSPELTREFMVIKQVLVGGSLDSITRPELRVAVDVLEDIRVELIRLKPHVRYLNPNLLMAQDTRDLGQNLSEANDALMQAIHTFSMRLQKSKQRYPYSNLTVFLREFRHFVGWEQHFENSRPVEDWVNLLKQVKGFAVSPIDPDAIRAVDWAPLLQAIGRWYVIFLEYEVGVKDRSVLEGVGLQNLFHLTQEIFTLVEDAVQSQPTKGIPFSQLTDLAIAFQRLKWISSDVRESSLKSAIAAAANRVFGNDRLAPSERRGEVLTLNAVTQARQEFYRWAYLQLNLDTRYNSQMGDTRTASARAVPNLQLQFFVSPEFREKLGLLSGADWDDFMKVKTLMRPLFPDGKDRVYLIRESELAAFGIREGFHNLSLMNIYHSLTGLLFRGYAEQVPARIGWDSGLRSEELQRFYEDFRGLAVDLHYADPRNINTGTRAFMEGNIFTYASDGFWSDPKESRSRLSFTETMTLVAYLYSGGLMSDDFYSDLVNDSCRDQYGPDKDMFNRPEILLPCVRDHLLDLILRHADNMPHLQAYIRSLNADERAVYAQDLMQSARGTSTPKNWTQVEKNELSTLAVVMQYSESVLTRFDADGDGRLNYREIVNAEPIFLGFIKKFAKDKLGYELSDWESRGAFLYLVMYDDLPNAWNFLNILNLSMDISGSWTAGPLSLRIDMNPEISLDRPKLAKIFKLIIAKMCETKPATEQPLENDSKAAIQRAQGFR